MPSCFQLVDKETKEIVTLNKAGEELCKLLGEDVDPEWYVAGIGVLIATDGERYLGSQKLRDAVTNWSDDQECVATLLACLDYLEAHYNSFYQ